MATIKRKKVSRVAIQGQKKASKKDLLHNKLFWIIGSIVLALFIGGAVWLTVYLVDKYKSSDEEKIEYISERTHYTSDGREIELTKSNYEGVMIHVVHNDFDQFLYQKHIFFFACDLSKFYPEKEVDEGKDDDETKLYSEIDKNALEGLIILQDTINKYNADILGDSDPENDDEVIYLYVIDTSVGNNSRVGSLSTFGSKSSSFCFGYIAGEDGFKGSYEYEDSNGKKVEKTIFATDLNEFRVTTLRWALDFIDRDLVLKVD